MDKHKALERTMAELAKEGICLAFPGEVDSSLLLKMAAGTAAKISRNVYAVIFDNRLHPSCDLEIVMRVAEKLGGIHKVISVDELEREGVQNNPVSHRYLYKRHLFQSPKDFTGTKGIRTIIDGTNEGDVYTYHPGIKALKELGIINPLAGLRITKTEVKSLAAEYGTSVASRPSTLCMATRLPHNTEISYEILERITQGEAYLRGTFSSNIRLHLRGGIVRVEMGAPAMSEVPKKCQQVVTYLKNLGFLYITLDLEEFRSGSMDVHVSNQDH